ncbi:hypothetical protein [Wenjunlia vitaminophila]|uniref:hypothetical protein n=1 Tax=Wenjunlia vitaminophila TaxID=76728 RepID=UPI0003683EC3|nr:hypothetical protein [Wenjunlia vitaminophila]
MPGVASATAVAALTTAAFAGVAFLGVQALDSLREGGSVALPPDATETRRHSPGRHEPTVVPPRSGHGKRVVYSVSAQRVWLVRPDGGLLRTFTVTPGAVQPVPGHYQVRSRTGRATGSDGVPVEHVVRFSDADGTPIGFSATVDEDARPGTSGVGGGAIREGRADGEAMWRFAVIDVPVVVVR